MDDRLDSRRRFLQVAGTVAVTGIAGCSGDGGDGGSAGGGDGGDEDGGNDDDGGEQQGSGDGLEPVPDEYATATAQDGTQRSPESVAEQSSVAYQSEPKDGEQCTDCRYYIPDKNDDGLGACAVVEGTIEPAGWCASFVQYEG